MNQSISIIFCGTAEFAVPSLRKLAANPAFRIQLVITQPDRPLGRKHVLTPPPVKAAALELGLPVYQPESLNKEFFESEYKDLKPDFLVVVAFGQILSQKILDLPTTAPINVHGSLLPRWRGASPMQHTILAGDSVGGVTTQIMVKALDAGAVLKQTELQLDARETYETLGEKLSKLGADLIEKTLLEPLEPKDQPKDGITICGLLERKDGECDASIMTAEEIDRKVRAFTPWPGVTLKIKDVMLKVLETNLEPQADAFEVACKDDSKLFLVKVQEPGKKGMSGSEWQRGR